MSRYIDAETIPDPLNEKFKETQKLIEAGETQLDNLAEGFTEAEKIVLFKAPAADVQEVKHGRWTIRYEGTYKRAKCYCSVCGKPNGIGGIISNQKKPYCPNCGAKMDLEDE